MDRLVAHHTRCCVVYALLHLESEPTHAREVALYKLPALVLRLGAVVL